jgi:retron-type reverse transcriptase
MKRRKHLYDTLVCFENLLQAARQAQRGKRFLPATLAFNHRLETELPRLQRELQTQTYQPGPYKTFTINDPKPRLISAAPYRDRVVHHALCNVLEPIFERGFIFDSYACRKNKGAHAAVDRLTHFMHGADFVLKCDLRKYFASVDHAILKALLRRKIGCEPTLALIDLIIDHGSPLEVNTDYFPGDHLFSPLERQLGLPIGNQTSQFFANVYLDPLDHYIKEELGYRRYIRYVDDFVVLADDVEQLWRLRDRIAAFLQENLRLRLHPQKQTVTPVTTGIDFLGYRVFPTHRRIRRTSGFRFRRNLKRMAVRYREGRIDAQQVQQRVAAWIGHAAHADTYGLRAALLDGVTFSRA